jgi:hypothetical protein
VELWDVGADAAHAALRPLFYSQARLCSRFRRRTHKRSHGTRHALHLRARTRLMMAHTRRELAVRSRRAPPAPRCACQPAPATARRLKSRQLPVSRSLRPSPVSRALHASAIVTGAQVAGVILVHDLSRRRAATGLTGWVAELASDASFATGAGGGASPRALTARLRELGLPVPVRTHVSAHMHALQPGGVAAARIDAFCVLFHGHLTVPTCPVCVHCVFRR